MTQGRTRSEVGGCTVLWHRFSSCPFKLLVINAWFSRCCLLCLSLWQPMVCFSGDQGQHLCKHPKNPISVPKAWEQTGLCCQVTSWNIAPMSHGLKGKLLCIEFGILGVAALIAMCFRRREDAFALNKGAVGCSSCSPTTGLFCLL